MSMSNVEVIEKTLAVVRYTADKMMQTMSTEPTRANDRAVALVAGLLASGLLDLEDD